MRRRASWEYSLKRSWVLALDITYRHGANTNVTGYKILGFPAACRIRLAFGRTPEFGFAPAIVPIPVLSVRSPACLLGLRAPVC